MWEGLFRVGAGGQRTPLSDRLHADTADQAAFTQMLATALDQLHEGSIARYRLRRSEYLAWQKMQVRP